MSKLKHLGIKSQAPHLQPCGGQLGKRSHGDCPFVQSCLTQGFNSRLEGTGRKLGSFFSKCSLLTGLVKVAHSHNLYWALTMCQTPFLVHELRRRTGQVTAPKAPSFQWTTQWVKVHKQIEQHNFQWCPFSGENKTAHCDREGLPGKDDLESLSRRKLSLEISPEPQEGASHMDIGGKKFRSEGTAAWTPRARVGGRVHRKEACVGRTGWVRGRCQERRSEPGQGSLLGLQALARHPPGIWKQGWDLNWSLQAHGFYSSVSTVMGRPSHHVESPGQLQEDPAALDSGHAMLILRTWMEQASKGQGSPQEQSDQTAWRWKVDPPFPLVTMTHTRSVNHESALPTQRKGSIDPEDNFFNHYY